MSLVGGGKKGLWLSLINRSTHPFIRHFRKLYVDFFSPTRINTANVWMRVFESRALFKSSGAVGVRVCSCDSEVTDLRPGPGSASQRGVWVLSSCLKWIIGWSRKVLTFGSWREERDPSYKKLKLDFFFFLWCGRKLQVQKAAATQIETWMLVESTTHLHFQTKTEQIFRITA